MLSKLCAVKLWLIFRKCFLSWSGAFCSSFGLREEQAADSQKLNLKDKDLRRRAQRFGRKSQRSGVRIMSKRQSIGDKGLKAGVGMYNVLQERQSDSPEPHGGGQLRMCVVGCGGDQAHQGWTGKGRIFHTRLKH